MFATLRVPALVLIGSMTLAGCSGGMDLFGGSSSSDVTTSSLSPATQAQKVDPACGNLALEIDTLRREGVADKVDRAATKKYKMTPTDLTKASQLNRANGEFQAKCSTLPRTAAMPDAPPAAAAAPAKAAPATVKAAVGAPRASAAAGGAATSAQ